MPVKLRLQRKGRKRRPFYHIVAADARASRDGKYIERIGWFNPVTNPGVVEIDRDAAIRWLKNGAQPTTTVKSILRHSGVLYKKHLLRGVEKGALTEEQANEMFSDWLKKKAKGKGAMQMNIVRTRETVVKPTLEEVVETVTENAAEVIEAVVEAATEVVEAAIEAEAEGTDTANTDNILDTIAQLEADADEKV